jgi:hypothetical protein
MEKSQVVLDIIEAVHQANGRFIKKESKGGPWIEADDIFAREKCTQSLRDGLSTKYRSATKAKRERRSQHDKQFHGDIDRIVASNAELVQQMESLSQQVSLLNSSRPSVSDEVMLQLFAQANANMLETMKSDPSMHQQFLAASRAADMETESQWGTQDSIHSHSSNNTTCIFDDEDMDFLDEMHPLPMPNMIEMY